MSVIQTAQTHQWQNTELVNVNSETSDFSEFFWSASAGAAFGIHPFGVFIYDQGFSGVEFTCPAVPAALPITANPPFPPVWPFAWNTSLIYGRENLNQLIPMIRHDDVRIEGFVSLRGERVNLTGAALTFTAKWNVLDASSVFTCTIGDGITVTDAAQGEIEILIASAKTNTLPYRVVRLVYDLQLLDGSGERHTIAYGTLLIRPDATRT